MRSWFCLSTSETGCTQCSAAGHSNSQAQLFHQWSWFTSIHSHSFTGAGNISFSIALHNFIWRSLALRGSAEQHPMPVQVSRLFVSRSFITGGRSWVKPLGEPWLPVLKQWDRSGSSTSPPSTCPCIPWELWEEVKVAPSADRSL